MSKTPAYIIATLADEKVASRTEGKAADKLAAKLTEETGQAHRVYTPTGKLRLETEVAVQAPVEETGEGDAPIASYATVQAQLADEDEGVREAAKGEWMRRIDIYREATHAKDPAKRIVGPAMAAALELGKTSDGRTRAALVKRGLAVAGEGLAFTVNADGRKALTAAVDALAWNAALAALAA